MKVKGAYYVPALPKSVVLVLPDDTVWAINDAPFRAVKEKELKHLPGYEIPALRRNVQKKENEIFASAYSQYGLEKVQ